MSLVSESTLAFIKPLTTVPAGQRLIWSAGTIPRRTFILRSSRTRIPSMLFGSLKMMLTARVMTMIFYFPLTAVQDGRLLSLSTPMVRAIRVVNSIPRSLRTYQAHSMQCGIHLVTPARQAQTSTFFTPQTAAAGGQRRICST